MRTAVTVSAAAILMAAFAAPAAAQPRPPISPVRPTYSPYLGLLWGGGNPAFNYYGLVRPQLQFQQQANMLQQQINQTNQAVQAGGVYAVGADPYLPITGRGAVFGYYSHYYPTLGGGGGGVVGVGGVGPRVGGYGGLGGGPIVPAFAANRTQIGTGQAPLRAAPGRGGAGGAGGVRR